MGQNRFSFLPYLFFLCLKKLYRFTVNPRRRIRQHNGEIVSGAWRTKKKRPWEMVFCIHGFPTNVSALQVDTKISSKRIYRLYKFIYFEQCYSLINIQVWYHALCICTVILIFILRFGFGFDYAAWVSSVTRLTSNCLWNV